MDRTDVESCHGKSSGMPELSAAAEHPYRTRTYILRRCSGLGGYYGIDVYTSEPYILAHAHSRRDANLLCASSGLLDRRGIWRVLCLACEESGSRRCHPRERWVPKSTLGCERPWQEWRDARDLLPANGAAKTLAAGGVREECASNDSSECTETDSGDDRWLK